MAREKDPTEEMRKAAEAQPGVTQSTSCNQASYKVGKKAFLYVGPGAKGVGYKAMFKLGASLEEADTLSKSEPDRYEIGVGNWVTTRFSAERPLPKKIWSRWLVESYKGATHGGQPGKRTAPKKS